MAKEPTTAELIEAIAQCKADILSAIQAKGGEINESTPFTEYAYAIQNLPTGSGGQYRLEIYDDMGKDNGQLVDPDDLRPMTRYSVYLYDIANDEYKEDAIDWDLITDDDGTLIYEIADGDTQSLSSCMTMVINMAEGHTMLYAVNPSDHSDVLIDQAITITDA